MLGTLGLLVIVRMTLTRHLETMADYAARLNLDALVDPLKLKLPVFGNLFRKIAMSRFSGLWVAIKAVTDTIEVAGIVGSTPERARAKRIASSREK